MEPITGRRAQLETGLPRLEAERDVLKIRLLSHEAATHDARDLAQRWEVTSFEERRQVMEAITDRITVGKEEIDATLVDA